MPVRPPIPSRNWWFPNTRAGRIRLTLLVVLPLAFAGGSLAWMIPMPGRSHRGPLAPLDAAGTALAARLEAHVRALAAGPGDRCLDDVPRLRLAETYLCDAFRAAGLTPVAHEYTCRGETVRNFEVEWPGTATPAEIVVIGAHYDSCGGPAANDNGSGVAALLELAAWAAGKKPARTLRLVAFVNEEPPYFQTAAMGSLVYAKRCAARAENVTAMLSLETIGYYDDRPGSQHYPWPFGWFYPGEGNFIAFVGNVGSRTLVRRCVGTFRAHAAFPSEGGALPKSLPGVGWSDQWSFWQCGYPGVMVTDTAPFRYPHYHKVSDTPDQVDYPRVARVVAGLRHVVADLAGISDP